LICEAVLNLVFGTETWQDVAKKLPTFEGQEVD
jgi:glycyl-tRNA synthetase